MFLKKTFEKIFKKIENFQKIFETKLKNFMKKIQKIIDAQKKFCFL